MRQLKTTEKTFEERIEYLEHQLKAMKRSNRLLLAIVVLVIVVFGSAWPLTWATPAAQTEKIVRANKFILEDANSKPRGELTVVNGGVEIPNIPPIWGKQYSRLGSKLSAAMLRLFDENGKERFCLAVDKDEPRLTLFNENGKPCGLLYVDEYRSNLALSDVNSNGHVELTADKLGPRLTLYDKNSKIRGLLYIEEDGPSLTLFDENGKPRIFLAVEKDGPKLDLADKNEKTRAMLGVNTIKTSDGKTITYPESSLVLLDPNEKVIWLAPR